MINAALYCQERLYKILTHDAKSAHGGSFDWTPYLPKYIWDDNFSEGYWKPGEWVEHKGDLSWCARGFHLTSDPLRWKTRKGRVFLAEYSGEYLKPDMDDKACFQKVRLLRELGIDALDYSVTVFKLITCEKSDLRSANLRYADLSSADLRYADLHGCYIDRDLGLTDYRFDNGRLWRK